MRTKLPLLFLFALLTARDADACICVAPALKTTFKHASAIFTGEVVSLTTVDVAPLHYRHLEVVLKVTESFKGPHRVGELVTVNTEISGDSGGMHFVRGSHYLVAADVVNLGLGIERLWTGLCRHSYSLSDERAPRAIALIRSRSWWWRLPFS